MSSPNFTVSPMPYVGNPIITLPPGSWYESQLFDPQVMVDPSDATKLIMFASGMGAPVAYGPMSIGRFTSTVADCRTWVEYGQVLLPGAPGQWDEQFVRMGSCFYSGATFYLFYSGQAFTGGEQIGLATSTDGITFTKYAGNPVLTPTGQGRNDGDYVSEPAVIKEGSSWTMIYSRRNGSLILPGFRYATSSDGMAWTKGGSGDVLTTDPLYGEFHQIIKIGTLYWLIFEAGSATLPYRIYAASSPNVTGPFSMPSSAWLNPSFVSGAWDRYHVATPNLVQVGPDWELFYCAAGYHDQPYYTNPWPFAVARTVTPYDRVDATAGGVSTMTLVPNAHSAKPYSASRPTPVIIFCRDLGSDQTALATSDVTAAVRDAMLDAGFIIAACNDSGWGCPSANDAYVALADYIYANYNVSYIGIWSEGMGGLCGLTAVGQGRIKGVAGWLGTFPICSLASAYNGIGGTNFSSNINTAFGITGTPPNTYALLTATLDPALRPASVYRSLPMRFYHSASDAVVGKSPNTDAMDNLIAATARESVVVTTSGAHGDASNFQPTDYVDFFKRCFAAPGPGQGWVR